MPIKQGMSARSAALMAAAERGAADAKAAAEARIAWMLTRSHVAATATLLTQIQQDDCDETIGVSESHSATQQPALLCVALRPLPVSVCCCAQSEAAISIMNFNDKIDCAEFACDKDDAFCYPSTIN